MSEIIEYIVYYKKTDNNFRVYNNIITKLAETFLASEFLKNKNPDYFINHIYKLVLGS